MRKHNALLLAALAVVVMTAALPSAASIAVLVSLEVVTVGVIAFHTYLHVKRNKARISNNENTLCAMIGLLLLGGGGMVVNQIGSAAGDSALISILAGVVLLAGMFGTMMVTFTFDNWSAEAAANTATDDAANKA